MAVSKAVAAASGLPSRRSSMPRFACASARSALKACAWRYSATARVEDATAARAVSESRGSSSRLAERLEADGADGIPEERRAEGHALARREARERLGRGAAHERIAVADGALERGQRAGRRGAGPGARRPSRARSPARRSPRWRARAASRRRRGCGAPRRGPRPSAIPAGDPGRTTWRRPPRPTRRPCPGGSRCTRSACRASRRGRGAARGSCGRAGRRPPCRARSACGRTRTRPPACRSRGGDAVGRVVRRGHVAARADGVAARARRRPLCGSWQSRQVTPAAYIRLCRNEPYS